MFANSPSKDYSLWKCLLCWCDVSSYERWKSDLWFWFDWWSKFSEVHCGLKELKWIELRKYSKLPTCCRFCLAQLSSEVSGTRGILSPWPLVKANPIHDRTLTNVHCVSNSCCLNRRDYDTYWNDKNIFHVAQTQNLANPKLQHFEFSIGTFVLNRNYWKKVVWSSSAEP